MIDLSPKIQEALNNQIANEGFASNFYLALAYWCDDQALEGCKKFFLRQAEEERMHMMKIYEYMSESGVHPKTSAIPQVPIEYSNIQEAFKKVFDQERSVTQSIHNLLSLAMEENDYNTQQFLQWYVDEQREEEAVIRTILDRIRIIGDGAQSLYYIDKEIEKINMTVIASASNQNGE
ncbi:MAG: ferritin [Saprospiraceae bacterium]|jgi:ferritin|nr:ferritin [Saprospiraceae bacterium]